MDTRGLPVLASWAGGIVGVPVCDTGGNMPWSDLSRSAVDWGVGAGAGTAAATGAGGVGFALGRFESNPLFDSEASRSPPLIAGVDAVWFCRLWSCWWLALCNAGAVARICGVPGFCPLARSA